MIEKNKSLPTEESKVSGKGKSDVNSEKAKALQVALSKIEKDFGEGAIMKMGKGYTVNVEVIPTGALQLDAALGIHGVPRGRIVEIFGPESSGKTTLTLSILANAQKTGGEAAFIDAEHAFDPTYAKKIGVNLDNLLISQPDNGEQALEIAETLIRSNAVDVVVIDSVAALTPKKEIEGEMGDSHVGLQARLMSQALRKLTSIVSKSKTCVIFINQIRMKIGISYGNPETTTGGNALKFYSSVRIDLRRIASLTKGETVVGNRVRAKIVKNKMSPPFREAEFDIMFDEGISRAASVIDMGEQLGIVKKTGTWLSFGEEKLGQGKENARIYLNENIKVLSKIEADIKKNLLAVKS
ncbi:recombinase RecA [Candidatus Omnitrophus magneticus]|uniref:Protein RecA n=1 Tax=Candidatus Omnitrophus magneticus TaxID=1609969 RepID=A0A0F0CPF1_9BACT|nr:recombinase RecA [Candidatus Omnitrophus magneticus]